MININRDEVAKYGMNIFDINQAINTAFAAHAAGLVFEGKRRYDLTVRLAPESRQSIEDVRNVFLTAPSGVQIPLKQLADVDFKIGPNQIQREDAKRRITVAFNVRGTDIATVVEEMQQRITREVRLPPGYYTTYGGQFENLKEAQSRLTIAVPVALLLIFVLLFFLKNLLSQVQIIQRALALGII